MIDRHTALRLLGLSSPAAAEAIQARYWILRAHLEERLESGRSGDFALARREELRELDLALRALTGADAPPRNDRAAVRAAGRMNPWLLGWALVSTALALSLAWSRSERSAPAPVAIEAAESGIQNPSSAATDDEARAWLTARAQPPGARLEISMAADGLSVAEGPADDTRYALLPGDYQLRVAHPACPDDWRQAIRLEAGESAELEPRTCAELGFLVMRSNVSDDRLAIDGRAVGGTGPSPHRLATGEHRVRVEKAGYRPWEGVIELEPAERLELYAELSPLEAKGQEPQREASTGDVAAPAIDVEALHEARRNTAAQSWHERVKHSLLSRYDRDRSGSLDSADEVRSIPCQEWLGFEQSYDASGLALPLTRFYGFDGSAWVESALGVDASMRVYAYNRMKECGLR